MRFSLRFPIALLTCFFQVLYLHDGQNVFKDSSSFSGTSWRAAESAAAAIESGCTPPFCIVALDHGGPLRSLDYLPVKPGVGMGGFRPEAAVWPGGGVSEYLDALADVVLPLAQAEFGVSADPARVALGGSSFGGIATLHAICCHRLGSCYSAALVESPSLWVEEGRYSEQVLLPSCGRVTWPERTFMAMGTREHTGTRKGAGAAGTLADELHMRGMLRLVTALRTTALLGPSRLEVVLEPEAAHNESDWARRLPQAIAFLMGPMTVGAKLVARKKSKTAQAAVHSPAPPDVPVPPVPVPPVPPVPLPPVPVRPVTPPPPPTPRQVVLAAAAAAAAAPPDAVAAELAGDTLFYFAPPELVAGGPARIFVNKRKLGGGVANAPDLRLHYGFDGWSSSAAALQLEAAAGLPGDWWQAALPPLPESASELSLALSDGAAERWDNNRGANYQAAIVPPEEASASAHPRTVGSCETHPMAGGTLHILTLAPRSGGGNSAAQARAERYQMEKVLRVWTPPGWSREAAPPGGYPVLYISDSQNLFEDWLSHSGVSWRAGETAAQLIFSGALPAFIIVGIDAAGAFRCLNFLPFPPGQGVWNFRPDCERWPGGQVDAYLRRVVHEILPLAEARFGASQQRERRVFGGASFGGMAALQAALRHPRVFGGVLAESPSLWAGEGRYLETLREHSGALPERLFLGVGTREYSGTREDNPRHDVDDLLLSYIRDAAGILEGKGIHGSRLRLQVDEGAAHHEGAWAHRLHGALLHLFHGR